MEQQLEIHTCPGNMGEDIYKQAGLKLPLSWGTKAWSQCSPSSEYYPKDTMDAAGMLCNEGVDLILFAGGDGTARNILDAVGTSIPVLGIQRDVRYIPQSMPEPQGSR